MTLKKLILFTLAAITVFTFAGCTIYLPADPDHTTEGTTEELPLDELFEFTELEDGTLEITDYNGDNMDVVIPAEINGKTVTSVADKSFENFTALKSITISEGVKRIGYYTFAGCSSAASIKLPESLEYIGDYCFKECSAVTEITVPDNVTYLGRDAFFGCSALTTAVIGDSVSVIEAYTFLNCVKLSDITLPDGIHTICEYAFLDCASLKSIELPDTVREVKENAFAETPIITNTDNKYITVGNGILLKYTGADTSIRIPTSIRIIANAALADIKNQTNTTIPSSVEKIGDYAVGYYYDEYATPVKIEGFTITGQAGSEAQEYAEANGFRFIAK